MKTNTGQDMAGAPAPVPGSAEGMEDIDKQSKVPLSSHTPGSAEGEDDPEFDGESDATQTPEKSE